MIAESKKMIALLVQEGDPLRQSLTAQSCILLLACLTRYDYDSAAVQYLCVFPATSFATNFRGYTICISLVPSYTDIKVYNLILL